MQLPTIPEILVLWVIMSIVIGFFIGFTRILFLNLFAILGIAGCIVAGFFIGIGIHIFEMYLKTL